MAVIRGPKPGGSLGYGNASRKKATGTRRPLGSFGPVPNGRRKYAMTAKNPNVGKVRKPRAQSMLSFAEKLQRAHLAENRDGFLHRLDPAKVDWRTLGMRPRRLATADKPEESLMDWLNDDPHVRIYAELYSVGVSVAQIADILGVVTFRIQESLHFRPDLYGPARQARAQHHADGIERSLREVRSGRILPDQGRVLITGQTWLAGKLDASAFGDRQSHELSGPNGGPIKTETDEAAVSRLVSKLMGPVVATQEPSK